MGFSEGFLCSQCLNKDPQQPPAMFNGQLLFDRPMHVKMVRTPPFPIPTASCPGNALLVWGDLWFQEWIKIQRGKYVICLLLTELMQSGKVNSDYFAKRQIKTTVRTALI